MTYSQRLLTLRRGNLWYVSWHVAMNRAWLTDLSVTPDERLGRSGEVMLLGDTLLKNVYAVLDAAGKIGIAELA